VAVLVLLVLPLKVLMEQTLFFQQLHQQVVAVVEMVAVLLQVLMVVQAVAVVLGQAAGLSLVARAQLIKGELAA
jgi:hypothetical protein